MHSPEAVAVVDVLVVVAVVVAVVVVIVVVELTGRLAAFTLALAEPELTELFK
jgi:uncharacterized membrane protein